MAADVYLQIDSVKGESNDHEHAGWIEVSSVTWGGRQPRSATASTAGGHTAERAELHMVSVTKEVDVSSPTLFQLMCQGKTLPKATLHFMRADGASRVMYYEVTLENVLIAESAKTYTGHGLMHEALALRFSKITEKYTQQKIVGGAGGNTMGSWNLATNRIS